MNIKVSTVVIWVILFRVCKSAPIAIEKKSDRTRNHEASSATENHHAHVRSGNRNEQIQDLQSHRRPIREENNSNRKNELPFSLDEFQALFRKYLDLFPQLRATINENEDSDDIMDSNKREREYPINQSGNLNVYIKGNVHIKGSVHITTSGNGNGMRNTYDGKRRPVPIPTEPQEDSDTVDIIGPEDSDVVIIPRNNYGNKISRPTSSVKLPAPKHQKL